MRAASTALDSWSAADVLRSAVRTMPRRAMHLARARRVGHEARRVPRRHPVVQRAVGVLVREVLLQPRHEVRAVVVPARERAAAWRCRGSRSAGRWCRRRTRAPSPCGRERLAVRLQGLRRPAAASASMAGSPLRYVVAARARTAARTQRASCAPRECGGRACIPSGRDRRRVREEAHAAAGARRASARANSGSTLRPRREAIGVLAVDDEEERGGMAAPARGDQLPHVAGAPGGRTVGKERAPALDIGRRLHLREHRRPRGTACRKSSRLRPATTSRRITFAPLSPIRPLRAAAKCTIWLARAGIRQTHESPWRASMSVNAVRRPGPAAGASSSRAPGTRIPSSRPGSREATVTRRGPMSASSRNRLGRATNVAGTSELNRTSVTDEHGSCIAEAFRSSL